ncbi:MAG TPA: hypothetical protein VK633_05125 [Verrucomicrobiae bacterium]|nr:hypothetical protein [Verrucomicrobiae bacterium]
MRYVVKDTVNNQFLSSAGRWTPFLSQAQRFPNGLSISLHLEGTTLIMSGQVQVVELPAG